jgi:hypothetical protein
LAVVFAERAGCLSAWKQSLEALSMWESQVIKEWKDAGCQEGREEGRQEGRQEGRREGLVEAIRAALIKLLRARFQGGLLSELTSAIEQTTDLDTLSRWFDAALTIDSVEAFCSLIQTPPPAHRSENN